MEEKVRIIGHVGHGTTLGMSIAKMVAEGHDIIIIDDLDEIRQLTEDISKIRSAPSLGGIELHPVPHTMPHFETVKPHEIKYPVTRKSKFNQKKRRK